MHQRDYYVKDTKRSKTICVKTFQPDLTVTKEITCNRDYFLNTIESFSSACITAFAMSVCLSVYLFVCLCVFPICATQPCWISMYILSLIIYVVCFAYGHAWEIFILSLQPTCQFLVQILQKYIHSQSDTNTCSNKTILFLF